MAMIDNEEILEHIQCGVCVYSINADNTLEICYANNGYYDLCEGDEKQLADAYKHDHLFAVCDEYRDKIKDFFVGIVTTHQKNEITYRCHSLKDNIKWVNVKASFVSGDSPENNRIYCTFFDVTSEVSNEMHLRSIVSNLPVAIVIFEAKGRLLHLKYISDSCVNISGFTAEETYGRNNDGTASDASPAARKCFHENEWDDIQARKNLSYTYQILCKDGSYKYVNLTLSPVDVNGSLLYYGSLRSDDYQGSKPIIVTRGNSSNE